MEILHLTGPAPLYTNTFLVLDGAGTAVAVDPAADAQAAHHLGLVADADLPELDASAEY